MSYHYCGYTDARPYRMAPNNRLELGLGRGVDTAHHAYQEFSKNPKSETLSRIPIPASVAAD
jgi:hypothetical protein